METHKASFNREQESSTYLPEYLQQELANRKMDSERTTVGHGNG